MPNNESKYIDALNSLKSGVKNEEKIKVRVNPRFLDLVEKIMNKMEWNISTAINSCITHTLSVNEVFSMADFEGFNLSDEFEPFELELTVKNENRIFEYAENNNLEFNEKYISYVLSESIRLFHDVLLGKVVVENGPK